MEIERKFLLKEVPSTLDLTDRHHISQGYIDTDPVVRIRRLDNDFILTIKLRYFFTLSEDILQTFKRFNLLIVNKNLS